MSADVRNDADVPFSDHALDRFVGTKLSEFAAAEIEDMSNFDPEQGSWVDNSILNNAFRGEHRYPYRQHAFALLRRAEVSFREYELARSQTECYLRGGRSVSQYFIALSHWENVLASSYVCCMSFQKFARLGKFDLFEPKDGSPLQRLNALYNLSKHAVDSQYPPESTLALWLDNTGLSSLDDRLDYAEISGDILPRLAEWANLVQDPIGLHEKAEEATLENEADDSGSDRPDAK